MSKDDSFAYKLDNNERESSDNDNKNGSYYDSPTRHDSFYDDEDEWNEYFMRKKSRLRRQNKARDSRDDRSYEDEW